MKSENLVPIQFTEVLIDGGFWHRKQETNRRVTLPIAHEHLVRTGRIDAFRLQWKPGEPNKPHPYWDSDVAKWIEAASYSLSRHPDPELEREVGKVVNLVVASQQPDGYLNSYITAVKPGNRFENLYVEHELYCAGHLIEAAVAWYTATGRRELLEAMCLYVEYIASAFGPDEGKRRGYPGHQEIELALVKLARATGEPKHLELAKYFIDERGSSPSYFDLEAAERGEEPLEISGTWQESSGRHSRFQAHLPIREQRTAEGHAVRAMYFFAAAADIAAETGDEELREASLALWRNVTRRRMFITGGIGSSNENERFTFDYDLPNETGYCETCASVGLVFWAHRMLQMEGDGEYADVMERALYNGILSGVSHSGDRFFYANPLEVFPQAHERRTLLGIKHHFKPVRQPWFDTACCPPNLARLVASLGGYVYSGRDDEIYVHLYVSGGAVFTVGGRRVSVSQETEYPWNGTVTITVETETDAELTLSLRLPGWCRREGISLTVNGSGVPDPLSLLERGYVKLKRRWSGGDTIVLDIPMPVERIFSHPSVRTNCGRIALQRGPLVYCLEEADNGSGLADVVISADGSLDAVFVPELLGGIVTIHGRGLRSETAGWDETLYSRTAPGVRETEITAVPYYAWGNRGPGEMLVWIRGT